MNMKFPDIKKEVLKLYKDEFLKLNNLKLGDTVEVEFRYHKLHPKFRSTKMERVTHTKFSKGILKENDDGLYVESIDTFPFYQHTSNGLTGRLRKEFYKRNTRTAIYKIRGGLQF